jgi:hypothetical protein
MNDPNAAHSLTRTASSSEASRTTWLSITGDGKNSVALPQGRLDIHRETDDLNWS